MNAIHWACAALLALGATACAAPPYLPARAEGAAPSTHGEHGEDIFEGARGIHLFEQWWRPTRPPKGVLLVVHGLKDHSNRYGELAELMVDRGFAVYALDLRGHARSEGMRVWVDSFDDYLDDLDAFVKHAQASEQTKAPNDPAWKQKPLFLFGHSMGGAIVTLFAITRKPSLGGLVLSGAALRNGENFLTTGGAKLAAALTPNAGVFQLDLDLFSRDPQVVAACKADPLVYQPGAPAHTAAELLSAIDRIGDRMEDVRVPLLVMHGEADKVTPPDGSRELGRRAKSDDKTLKVYPSLVHDLVHEPEKATVLADVANWLEARAR